MFFIFAANLPVLQDLLIINGLQLTAKWQSGSKLRFLTEN